MLQKTFTFVILLFLLVNAVAAETFRGRVVKVYDGDSISIILLDTLDEQEIRLQGADAPERGQPCWREAQLFMAELLHGGIVRVEVEKRDRYKRLVGRVFLEDKEGLDVEKALIRAGLAWHYSYFNHEPDLANAQKEAQAEKLGIWQESDPIDPYLWRKAKKKNASTRNADKPHPKSPAQNAK